MEKSTQFHLALVVKTENERKTHDRRWQTQINNIARCKTKMENKNHLCGLDFKAPHHFFTIQGTRLRLLVLYFSCWFSFRTYDF